MRVRLNNVGVISDCDLEFVPGINLIVGSSGSGKSTLMRSIYNLVSNEFSDSDISFGKNTMHIRVDYNDNFVEYSRSLKAKGERCYYIVNSNQYVKLGRQPLQQVLDTLNFGDIDISGDIVNFNFNLQFSSPFLILGSQSTLYKVLTYRSTFDISSINDIYSADVKNNANEISANSKLRDSLEESLDLLNDQAADLSPIEKLYSDYTVYKHRLSIKNDVESLLSDYNDFTDLTLKISEIESLDHHIKLASDLILKINDIYELNKSRSSFYDVSNRIEAANLVYDKLNASMHAISVITDLLSLLEHMGKIDSIDYNLNAINKALNLRLDIDIYTINDIVKQRYLLNSYNKCDRIICTLSNKCDSTISTVDNLVLLNDKLSTLHSIYSKLSDIYKLSKDNSEELSKFKVCPLCGNSITESCHYD